MATTVVRVARDRLLRPFLSFRELQHAPLIVAMAFSPALIVAAVFEASLPNAAVAAMCQIDRSAVTGQDYAPILNYYVAWITHGFIALGVAYFSARSAFRNMPIEKVISLKRFRLMAFLSGLLLVIASDAAHCDLAMLSHERIFRALSLCSSLAPLFQSQWMTPWHSISTPTTFALFPLSAIAAAFWSAATIILCASRFLVEFERTDPATLEERIHAYNVAMEELRSHFTALGVVLVTSTVTTVAYLRTPLGFIAEAERVAFRSATDAVGLIWGGTFSLILLAICIYPFRILRERFDVLAKDADGINHGEILAAWVRENRIVLQVPANVQMVVSVLLPATVAVLAHLVPT